MKCRLKSVPPVLRTGMDLVTVSDVASSVETFGDRYLQRVYSEREIETCTAADGSTSAERLAARFAAKEAVVKALRPDVGLDYRSMEVMLDAAGAPTMSFSGAADKWVRSLNVLSSSVSLTHDGGLAGAIFVAMIDESAPVRTKYSRRKK